MATNRQDAWTHEDDQVLADITLQYIREGGTQLTAFEEVGELLNRTPAACGFRWNSTVRKQYEDDIKQAKSDRNRRSFNRRFSRHLQSHPQIYREEYAKTNDYLQAIDNMIYILRQYKQDASDLHRSQSRQLEDKDIQIQALQKENREIQSLLEDVKIMDKMRKISAADGIDHHIGKINR